MLKYLKIFIKMIVVFSLFCALAGYIYYYFCIKPDPKICHQLLMQPQMNQDFVDFINSQSEKSRHAKLWKNIEHIDEITDLPFSKVIMNNPTHYLGDSLKVLSSLEYDTNQKRYVRFYMKQLPIKQYMCFMDVANKAYENHIIDDKLLDYIISPSKVWGNTGYYTWLPDWRKRFDKHAKQIYSKDIYSALLSWEYLLFSTISKYY